MENRITTESIKRFYEKLIEDEKSTATIEKYLRDVNAFLMFIGEASVTKETVMQYKEYLKKNYKPSSVNSMLAALNRFFREIGWLECIVKSLKIQREAFRSKERELNKEEYFRLLKAAKEKGNMRLYLLMQALCSTGIRVSELPFITVEAVKSGQATVSLKGKIRRVLLPAALRRELNCYIHKNGLKTGSIFVTKNGRPMDRSNILHEMKALSVAAGIERKKVFPHNLRHLFACLFYQKEKDPIRLADLLGHSNVNTTRIYTCISDEEQDQKIEQLGLVIEVKRNTA